MLGRRAPHPRCGPRPRTQALLVYATWRQYKAQVSLQNITYVGDADMSGALFHTFDDEEDLDEHGGSAYNAF